MVTFRITFPKNNGHFSVSLLTFNLVASPLALAPSAYGILTSLCKTAPASNAIDHAAIQSLRFGVNPISKISSSKPRYPNGSSFPTGADSSKISIPFLLSSLNI